MVKRTLADKIIADLFRYPEWRTQVCTDPETTIGKDWYKLSTLEKTTISNIACGSTMSLSDIEVELGNIGRSMMHYVTD